MEVPLREYLTAAIRYWEPWRIVYNVVLAAVVGIYFKLAWPNSRLALHTDTILVLFLRRLRCGCFCPDVWLSGHMDVSAVDPACYRYCIRRRIGALLLAWALRRPLGWLRSVTLVNCSAVGHVL